MKIGFAIAAVLCIAAATLPCLEAKQAASAARKLKFSEDSDSHTEGHLLAGDPAERQTRDLKSSHRGGSSGYGGSYRHGPSYYRKPTHSYYSKPYTYKHGYGDGDKKHGRYHGGDKKHGRHHGGDKKHGRYHGGSYSHGKSDDR